MINPIFYQQNLSQNKISPKNISFRGCVQTLTHTNIGSCLEGYIGKVRVRNSNNQETFLNVFKRFLGKDCENYTILNDKNELIGNVNLFIVKALPTPWQKEDPCHVFVDDLMNFSKPNTPYHNKNLEHYKDIGIRLLQIAQRRSDEARCNGNIKLITVSEKQTFDWYLNKIGMRQEYPPNPNSKYNYHNPNLLYLPPENKESLSRLHGGL